MDPLSARMVVVAVRKDRRISLKNFNELPRRNLQIKSKQPAVLVKIKMTFHPQHVAIEGGAGFQVFCKDTKMCERFDHICSARRYARPPGLSNRIRLRTPASVYGLTDDSRRKHRQNYSQRSAGSRTLPFCIRPRDGVARQEVRVSWPPKSAPQIPPPCTMPILADI
jgi:hypothetical protein